MDVPSLFQLWHDILGRSERWVDSPRARVGEQGQDGSWVPRPPAKAGLPVPSHCLSCPCQGLISRGYSYTLQKNNGESWDLTDSAGNKLTAPAVCFMIPPTDPEALALADRYRQRREPVWTGSTPGPLRPCS